MTSKKTWTFKMDFKADPDSDHKVVKNDLVDMIRSYPGSNIKGNKLVMADAEGALTVKLRYFNNIVSIA